MTPQTPKTVMAGIERDAGEKPKYFTLTLGTEVASLNPGRSWTRVDEFKWVTRGLIEPPQSFHIHADGAVDINGETIRLDDPEGCLKLEREINKHHAVQPGARPAPAAAARAPQHPPNQVWFAVKLDHFGHLAVECHRGQERVETGLRGLSNLVHMGLMRAPQAIHVDPLQRGLELDGTWYEATQDGARQLAETLNRHYAPAIEAEADIAIEIKENVAAATGFDIHFFTVASGARFEVKGHLSQEKLDLLQDPAKCDLLQPGIILRISPPHLLIRRRRRDGGEEHLPELPDVSYRRVSAHDLQALFNHPLVRRREGVAPTRADQPPPALVGLRLVHNPANLKLLWLECSTTAGGAPEMRAFTHHNVADLQHQGAFLDHLDVTLSIDNRTLGILDRNTVREKRIELDCDSPETVLAEASRILTNALKPPPAPAAPPDVPPPPPAPAPRPAPLPPATPAPALPRIPTGPVPVLDTVGSALSPDKPPPPPAPSQSEPTALVRQGSGTPAPDSDAGPTDRATSDRATGAIPEPGSGAAPAGAGLGSGPQATESALAPPHSSPAPRSPGNPGRSPAAFPAPFVKQDPLTVNRAVFDQLVSHLTIPVQDLLLSLPRAFTDRRFQILSFSHPEIGSILDLRSRDFFGFYLSHVNDHNVLLVYACQDRHVEFGPLRCLLQPSHAADPHEFKGPALLGLAQDSDNNFVFVVTPAYRQWAVQYERAFHDACVRFATPQDVLTVAARVGLIWPVP